MKKWALLFMVCSSPVMAMDEGRIWPFSIEHWPPKENIEERRALNLRLAKETDCHTSQSLTFTALAQKTEETQISHYNVTAVQLEAYMLNYHVKPLLKRYSYIIGEFCDANPYASLAQANQYYWENFGWQEARAKQ